MSANQQQSNPPTGATEHSLAPSAGSAPYRNGRYDHDEVRCELMADVDCDTKVVGEPRTCCVCVGHDCQEARDEREKHPAQDAKRSDAPAFAPATGSESASKGDTNGS
jgi:hypothetical protein